jgi:hypothetical protein
MVILHHINIVNNFLWGILTIYLILIALAVNVPAGGTQGGGYNDQ